MSPNLLFVLLGRVGNGRTELIPPVVRECLFWGFVSATWPNALCLLFLSWAFGARSSVVYDHFALYTALAFAAGFVSGGVGYLHELSKKNTHRIIGTVTLVVLVFSDVILAVASGLREGFSIGLVFRALSFGSFFVLPFGLLTGSTLGVAYAMASKEGVHPSARSALLLACVALGAIGYWFVIRAAF